MSLKPLVESTPRSFMCVVLVLFAKVTVAGLELYSFYGDLSLLISRERLRLLLLLLSVVVIFIGYILDPKTTKLI